MAGQRALVMAGVIEYSQFDSSGRALSLSNFFLPRHASGWRSTLPSRLPCLGKDTRPETAQMQT